jgi:P-type Ca2+ transporter type 2C
MNKLEAVNNNTMAGENPKSTIGTQERAYSASQDDVLAKLQCSRHGLTEQDAKARLIQFGPNAMPQEEPPGILKVFLRQFASPLIYVLLAAAVFSLLIQEMSDAIFIGAVLLVNAIIGTIQEYSAQRAATALRQLVTPHCSVLREGDTDEINAEELVPGDIVLLESGDSIPADLRLLICNDLEVDESLLTGESMAVVKDAERILDADCTLGDKVNMAFAGTLVNRGRAQGVVVGTALNTELGKIAAAVLGKPPPKPPLMVRMERFTHKVAIMVASAALIMGVVSLMRGMAPGEIFMLAVALAVSAIPEGLPVALTVALAISMRRMSKRNVIVRQLVAVEALGSCTYIATDKTGTLTENQLTARQIVFPDNTQWEITGESLTPSGTFVNVSKTDSSDQLTLVRRLCYAAALANEASLTHRNGSWMHHGDAVDVALLVMARKHGMSRAEMVNDFPELGSIPFESSKQLSATLNKTKHGSRASVKGAFERLLPMCHFMATADGDVDIEYPPIEEQARAMAQRGFRVIAIACGAINLGEEETFNEEHLESLTLIGLIGMIDPLRKEAKKAVTACRQAGVNVAMVTGDHPVTALAIAQELNLADSPEQIVTGPQLKQATSEEEVDQLTRDARVFARVEPQQKLDIIQSLQRNGHYVAVSGDGANDAPALRAAQVGVAMGKNGTDVARETSELVITDDNFASIVAGIEEGRVAYANVRKVIFLLISTGVAELVLFTLALITNLPLPLLAVQLLWLNLVTNGIQDVALAFEPGEGRELSHPPRPPKEAIFNPIMIERVVVSAIVMGVTAFLLFQSLYMTGMSVDDARNSTLLLMVLFENVHVFNCRSETLSVFKHNLLLNPLLLFGTTIAQLIHIAAMYTPWFKDVLEIKPVSFEHWLQLLVTALLLLVVMEIHKRVRNLFPFKL